MEKCVLLKLSRTPGRIDFLDAHKKVIEEHGYVDFARISKGRICAKYICGKTIFIKESKTQGDRLFEATVGDEIAVGEYYPDYYDSIELNNPQWIRIKSLKQIDKDFFLREYHLVNGKNLEGTFRGSIPWVFVKKD